MASAITCTLEGLGVVSYWATTSGDGEDPMCRNSGAQVQDYIANVSEKRKGLWLVTKSGIRSNMHLGCCYPPNSSPTPLPTLNSLKLPIPHLWGQLMYIGMGHSNGHSEPPTCSELASNGTPYSMLYLHLLYDRKSHDQVCCHAQWISLGHHSTKSRQSW